ncbi:hypothetical protein BJY01DRAFT_164291 [Aspergillus pseudoustus]|uniref:PBP domain-containing protein n=1 Tax=Aspergillus pseudoustus TaxID=1810923 RepID=A0ABR4K625_9EURO
MAAQVGRSAVQQHGPIASAPKEIYGDGPVLFRIGNGGAGGTGLIAALATDYLSQRGPSFPGSIEWICNHSRNTQIALLHGYIDLALTYEREQEEISVSEGWATPEGCVFHDHFCLAGPRDDPAGIRGVKSVVEAFDCIAARKALFHSRSDGSATMWKERGIWQRCHRRPWADNAGWYIQSPCIPSEAVARADAEGAYLLCDRSTLLTQTAKGAVANLAVFLEPTDAWHELMNSCYALTSPATPKETAHEVGLFLGYLKSPRGRRVVAEYGAERAGLPLFATLGEGYARSPLVGGQSKNKRWATGGKAAKL